MDGQILELASFRLKPGIDEAALLQASARFQSSFLKGRMGFVRRELVATPDGGYADLVWWASMEAAQAVMKEAMESPICAAYFAVMAEAGNPAAGVVHYRSLKGYPA